MRLTFDMRNSSRCELQISRAKNLQTSGQGNCSEEREVEAFYSILDETEPFEAPHNSPLVRACTLAVMEVEQTRPTLIRKTGTGDMNVLGNQYGISQL